MARQKAVNITDAVMSVEDERRIRTTRYIVMMSIRIVLVVLCGVLVMADAPFLVVWLPLCAVGMAVLPWLAVLLANDRLAKEKPPRFGGRGRRARTLEAPERPMIDSELSAPAWQD
ncbi:DUF3099 domain-containing protein [Glycomyces sp. A-F 0318]|uniref:DUF3099 domain-containing protein n=1 Tax=Glycomyces amatae TaxID=2881355 RepID=UPI001E4A09CD|nr:DUF3099 domain-containing protein [Glycomyces amatae]